MQEFDTQTFWKEMNGALDQEREILKAVDEIVRDEINKIYFIGVGGSLAIMQPLEYLLRRYTNLCVESFYASEFSCSDVWRVDKHTLCIFSSKSGNTPETVRAAELCHERTNYLGAFLTQKKTALGNLCTYQWINDADENFAESFLIQGMIFAARLIYHFGEVIFDYKQFIEELERIPKYLVDIRKNIDKAKIDFGEKNVDTIYYMIIASGVLWGLAYSNAMCVWEEKLWVYGKTVHAGEFFHGPVEVINLDTSVVVLKGEDETRQLADKVEFFGEHMQKDFFVMDTKNCVMPDISPELREFFCPLIMNANLNALTDSILSAREKNGRDTLPDHVRQPKLI